MGTIVIEQGPRNYVVHISGSAMDTVVAADVSALNPPCRGVRLMRVSYDIAPEGAANLQFQGDTDPFLSMSSGSGQTLCYKKIGGIPNRNINTTSNGDVALNVTAAGAYSITLHFVKEY